jgi:23S rRNA G2445 N2-methylase RlmL
MAGALNATIASALIELTQPRRNDHFLNLMCGSGTLLIERLQRGPVQLAFGGDLDVVALASARRNIAAARLSKQISLIQIDGCRSSLPAAAFDVICADLPWGQLIGSHTDNTALYPALLAEASRLAAPGARLALLTHEIKLMEGLLKDETLPWALKDTLQVFQGGLRPKIYLMARL